jgi:hypothetical protein
MNKAQKTLAGLLGVVIAELAVVDYAAMEFLRNGFQMEVDLTELEKAEKVVEADMAAEGIELIEEGE